MDLDTEYEAAITRSDRPSQAKPIYRHTGGGPVCRGSVAVRGRRSCMYATTLERGLLLWELSISRNGKAADGLRFTTPRGRSNRNERPSWRSDRPRGRLRARLAYCSQRNPFTGTPGEALCAADQWRCGGAGRVCTRRHLSVGYCSGSYQYQETARPRWASIYDAPRPL